MPTYIVTAIIYIGLCSLLSVLPRESRLLAALQGTAAPAAIAPRRRDRRRPRRRPVSRKQPEAPRSSRALCSSAQGVEGVAEDLEGFGGFFLGQGHRRGHPEDVAVEAALADQQAAVLGLLLELGRRAAASGCCRRVRRSRRPASGPCRGRRRARGLVGDPAQAVDELGAALGGVRLQVVVEHVVDRRLRRAGRDRVAAEGRQRVRARGSPSGPAGRPPRRSRSRCRAPWRTSSRPARRRAPGCPRSAHRSGPTRSAPRPR